MTTDSQTILKRINIKLQTQGSASLASGTESTSDASSGGGMFASVFASAKS